MLETISVANLSTVVGGCGCAQQQGVDPNAGADPQQQQPQQLQQEQQGGDAGASGQAGSPCQQLIAGIMQLVNQFASQSGGQR
jgi:hypothetical protein